MELEKKYDILTGRRLIDAERYLLKLYEIDSHYNYTSHAIASPESLETYWSIQKRQLQEQMPRFLKDPSPTGVAQFSRFLDDEENTFLAQLPAHLQILRRQCAVGLHSLLEGFMSHVVEVYIEYFPDILKRSGRKVNLNDIVDHRNDLLIFLTEAELHHFDRLGLPKKYTYFRKELRLDPDIWGKGNSKHMIDELNQVRDEVIHGSEDPHIDDFWIRARLDDTAGFMFRVAAVSHVEKGVLMKFIGDSASNFKYPEEPTLGPS